jgi:hypothetical protein
VSSPLKLRKTSYLIPCGWAVVKVEGVDGDGRHHMKVRIFLPPSFS